MNDFQLLCPNKSSDLDWRTAEGRVCFNKNNSLLLACYSSSLNYFFYSSSTLAAQLAIVFGHRNRGDTLTQCVLYSQILESAVILFLSQALSFLSNSVAQGISVRREKKVEWMTDTHSINSYFRVPSYA